jgi:hypothetical protein
LISSLSAIDSVPRIGRAQTTNNVLCCDIKKYSGQESRREPTICFAKFNPGVSSNGVQIHTFELKPGLSESEFIYEIIVQEQMMHYIPYLNTKMFKNIVKLIIQKTNLKEIHKENLEQFPELAILEIRNTDLTTIDKDLFELNPKLTTVILTGNQITSIPFETILRITTFETDTAVANDLQILKKIDRYDESKLQIVDKNAQINALQTEMEKTTQTLSSCQNSLKTSQTKINELTLNPRIQSQDETKPAENDKIPVSSSFTENHLLPTGIISSLIILNLVTFGAIFWLIHKLNSKKKEESHASQPSAPTQNHFEFEYDPSYDQLPDVRGLNHNETNYDAVWEAKASYVRRMGGNDDDGAGEKCLRINSFKVYEFTIYIFKNNYSSLCRYRCFKEKVKILN